MVKALRVPNERRGICAKLQLPFVGPYMIDNEHGKNSYVLKDIETENIRGIWNIQQLYKYQG